MRRLRRCVFIIAALACSCGTALADVTRVDITKRADVGLLGYEKIVGTIHFEVDPADRRNHAVVDLDKAPVNAAGRVEFSSDLYILKPKAPRGNGAALVDVLNRGNKVVLNGFNRGGSPDPADENEVGDRFLMRFGFTLVWVGWEFDVPDRPMATRIRVPTASENGAPIAGIVRAKWTANAAAKEFVVADLARYDASDPDGADSQLAVCDRWLAATCTPIARSLWHVKGHTVTFEAGFEAGKTYTISYRATNPPIAGLGFVAVRDTTAWLKYQAAAAAPVRFAYAFGSSQSGRFLRSFLYEGFNSDERDRQVFDGVFAHIAGASRIELNARWSTPTGLGVHSATAFPFADSAQRDPVTGAREGLLENPRARHTPKVFYTNTPVEYWGIGRAAALVHTDPAGATDIELPDNVRLYFIAGTQHSPSRFPPSVGNGQQQDNTVDYWWTMRALLLAMHRWVKEGIAPPPSRYPRLSDGTLVPVASIAFPAIPGVASPRTLTAGARAANRLLPREGGAGVPLPLLVPAVDEDGNERAGIRLPDVAVPLATYTGWNFRTAAIGSPGELVPLLGATIPFAPMRAAREAAKDPRRSIEERYRSRDEYLAQVEKVLDALVLSGYLIYDDGPRILQRATDQWDVLVPAR